MNAKNLVAGAIFGRLTLLEAATKRRDKLLCRCACGTVKRIDGGNILTGASQSCGCAIGASASERMRKHGGSRSPEYVAWTNAKARCHRKTHPRYPEWGGRGIAMCARWRDSFDAFLADMGTKPGPDYSIDRIDNDRGYEPGNCRWTTAKTQATNRPNWTRVITFGGETLTVTDWAARIGVSRKTLCGRLDSGWTIDLALTAPKGSRREIHRARTSKGADLVGAPNTPTAGR